MDSGFHVLDSGLQSLAGFWIPCGEFPGFRITLGGTRDVLTPPPPHPMRLSIFVKKRAIFVEISNGRCHISEDLVGICISKLWAIYLYFYKVDYLIRLSTYLITEFSL